MKPGALACLALGLALAGCAEKPSPESKAFSRPNILLIMLDDLGVNDLGRQNPGMHTPHIDRLASQGVYFSRHYVDSTCAATRAGLMSGMAPARLGFRPSHQGISPEIETLPELLRGAGYQTHHVGKWHLGFTTRLALPAAQGFDSFYGFLDQMLLGGPPVESPRRYQRPRYKNPWLQENDDAPQEVAGHLTGLLAQRAVSTLDQLAETDAPWFLNLWFYAPHTPIQPAREYAQQYPPTPEGRYRALVHQLDAAVGQVLRRLDALGLRESTLVMLASDNGGTNRQLDNNAPLTGTKMTFLEGGVRTPLILSWPQVIPAGAVTDQRVSYLDYLPTLVQLAGVEVSPGLRGRNLVALLQGEEPAPGAYFWQAVGGEGQQSWAVLSADGRWRLSDFFVGGEVLNDLQADPAGGTNVIDAEGARAAQLRAEFSDWADRAAEVPTVWRETDGDWLAALSGSSLQRSPGYGPHTFAIGVTPMTADTGEPWQLLSQAGRWGISYEPGRLRLQINEQTLEVPAPGLRAPGCHALVVSSRFQYSRLQPATDFAWMTLYLDGERLGELRSEVPGLPVDDWLDDTYLGARPAADLPPPFQLGRPVVLNSSLLEYGNSEGRRQHLQQLHARVCERENAGATENLREPV